MTIALAPGVIGRLLSLRDVVQTLERVEALEGGQDCNDRDQAAFSHAGLENEFSLIWLVSF